MMPIIDPVTLNIILENSDPNGIVTAPAGLYLYRNGLSWSFHLSDPGLMTSLAIYQEFLGSYKTQPWFTSLDPTRLVYAHPSEVWYKNSGTGNTDWMFIGYGTGEVTVPVTPPAFVLTYMNGEPINALDTIDFGPIPISGTVSMSFLLVNTGSQDLSIDYISIFSGSSSVVYIQGNPVWTGSDGGPDFSSSLGFDVGSAPFITVPAASSIPMILYVYWDYPFSNSTTLNIGNNVSGDFGNPPFDSGWLPVQYNYDAQLIAEPAPP